MKTYTVRERSAFSVYLRVQVNGEPVTQADLSSITWKVFPEAGGDAVATGTLTVATAVYDTLQTGDEWTEDDTGYNVRHDVLATSITNPGRYVIEYKITPTSGSTGAFYTQRITVNAEEVFTA